MKPEEWRQVDWIFNEALDREPGERTQFVKEACAGNPSLQESVESLIASHKQAGSFLESGAAESVPARRVSIAAGTRLGRYEIVASIASGGMGEVYKAYDARLRRDVAVKVLQQVDADGAAWERFVREARAASALSHPNICTVYDVGEDGGQPYLVMELLEGVTLGVYMSGKPLETDKALAIAVQIAEALEAAHAKGIIHRDIKPANVMIDSRGRVKVLDFGLAKQIAIGDMDVLTQDAVSIVGTVMGTAPYLSPEVLQSAPADARSDLWAFGVLLYQMLTGHLPFTGATMFELSAAILKEPAPPLPASVPVAMRSIVERCLAKRPEERYQNAGEVRSALDALATSAALVSGIRRRTWLLAASAAAVSAIGLLEWLRPWNVPSSDVPRPTLNEVPLSKDQVALADYGAALDFERKESDIPKAMAKLKEAIERDHGFFEARCRYGFEFVLLLLNGFSNNRSILIDAEKELESVKQDAPTLSSLPGAFTALYMAQGLKDKIPLNELNQMIKEKPKVTTNRLWRMVMYIFEEEDEKAEREALDLLNENINLAPAHLYLGDLLRRKGRIEEAINHHTTVLKYSDRNVLAYRYLALAYMDQRNFAEARRQLDKAYSLVHNNYALDLTSALLLAAEGEQVKALQAMNKVTRDYALATFTMTSDVAEFYAELGDTGNAVTWLRSAVRNGDERAGWFERDPRLLKIQKDKGFVSIIESIRARHKSKPILNHN